MLAMGPTARRSLADVASERPDELCFSTGQALADKHCADAYPCLVESLKDSYRGNRWDAVCALRQLGDKRAIQPLKALLVEFESPRELPGGGIGPHDPDPDICAEAAKAIEALQAAGPTSQSATAAAGT